MHYLNHQLCLLCVTVTPAHKRSALGDTSMTSGQAVKARLFHSQTPSATTAGASSSQPAQAAATPPAAAAAATTPVAAAAADIVCIDVLDDEAVDIAVCSNDKQSKAFHTRKQQVRKSCTALGSVPHQFKRSRHSRQKVQLNAFVRPVQTAAEKGLFIELYFTHSSNRHTDWQAMTVQWNMTALEALLADCRSAATPTLADTQIYFKYAQQLQTYGAKLAAQADEQYSPLAAHVMQVYRNQSHSGVAATPAGFQAAAPPAATPPTPPNPTVVGSTSGTGEAPQTSSGMDAAGTSAAEAGTSAAMEAGGTSAATGAAGMEAAGTSATSEATGKVAEEAGTSTAAAGTSRAAAGTSATESAARRQSTTIGDMSVAAGATMWHLLNECASGKSRASLQACSIDNGRLLCGCGLPVNIKVSQTSQNPNRQFVRCVEPQVRPAQITAILLATMIRKLACGVWAELGCMCYIYLFGHTGLMLMIFLF